MNAKKILSVLLGVLMINSASPLYVPAASADCCVTGITQPQKSGDTYGDYEYSSVTDGVVINKYKGTSGSVIIPSQINGNTVKYINSNAFSNCRSIKNVTIPDSVTMIGASAFQNCVNLESINIPAGVEMISENAFLNCENLTNVSISEGVKAINNSAFKNCLKLTGITLHESIQFIGDSAFYACKGLTEIAIPESVAIIGDNAFSLCTGLKNVNIRNCAASIGKAAFAQCTGITTITIPESITDICTGAFAGCEYLRIIYFTGTRQQWETFGISSDSMDTEVYFNAPAAFEYWIDHNDSITINRYKGSDTEVIIPDMIDGKNVIALESCTFANCSGIKSITLPKTLKMIGMQTYDSCTGLTSIDIPEGVSLIEDQAFFECSNLTNIDVDPLNKNYASVDGVLYNKDVTSLLKCPGGKTSLEIPATVTDIHDCAFQGSRQMTQINLHEGITTIGSHVFQNCTSLETIYLPLSLTSIGDYTFYDVDSLKDIHYGGTQDDWYNLINNTGNHNEIPKDTVIHFSSPLPSDTETDSADSQTGFKCTFVINGGSGKVNVYNTHDYTKYDLENVTEAYARDPETGEIDTEGLGQINFSVVPDPGYFIEIISASGNYKTLKGPSDTNTENTYRITKVLGDLTVTINLKAEDTESSEDTETNTDTATEIPEDTQSDTATEIHEDTQSDTSTETSEDTQSDTATEIPEDTQSDTATEIPEDTQSDTASEIPEDTQSDTAADTASDIPTDNDTDTDTSTDTDTDSDTDDTSVDTDTSTESPADTDTSTDVTDDTNKTTDTSSDEPETYDVPETYDEPEYDEPEYDEPEYDEPEYDEPEVEERSTAVSVSTDENDKYLDSDYQPPVTDPNDFDYNKNSDGTYSVVRYKGGDKAITIPSEYNGAPVTKIVRLMKYNNEYYGRVIRVFIPDSIKEIGSKAFSDYTQLRMIDIPDSVEKIGDNAFYNCSNLKSIEIPDGVTEIGVSAFSSCTSLEKITIPNSVTKIGQSAFFQCENLKDIKLSPNMTQIEMNTFAGCINLESISIPVGITEIGYSVFEICQSLKDVYYGGTEEQWNSISNKSSTGFLNDATIHYLSYLPGDTGIDSSDTPDIPVRKVGDINNDGKITAKDAMLIQRYAVHLIKLDDEQLLSADVNGDNRITNKDALEIVRYTIHMSKNDNIGKNIS